jgi:hypothetical protein
MSIIGGELWVDVKPLTTGFGPQLEKDITASSREAGVVAGKSAGSGFAQGFRSEAGVGTALKSELGDAERGAGAATLGFRGLGRAVAYASGTFLAVGGLAEGLKSSISTAAELSGNLAIVERQIKNVGAANAIYGKSIEDVIRASALQTGFSENDLVPAYGRLVSATKDSAKAYKDLGLAEDVARARHIGVAQAALALGKAEQGSVTSLQRLGIIMPAYAKNLDAAQKATAALAIVQARYGGTANAFAQTSAGSLARLSVAAEVLKETIGAALLPEVDHLANGLSDWFSKSQNLEKVQKDVATGASAVEGAVKGVSAVVKALNEEFGPLIDALGGVKNASELVFGALALRKVVVYGQAVANWATGYAASLTRVTAATTAEAAATTAATAAAERQIAVYGARGEILSTVTLAEGRLATATEAEGGASALGGLGGVGAGAIAGRAGLAGAALFAGYTIGNTAIDKLGLRKPIQDFGGAVDRFVHGVSSAVTQTNLGLLHSPDEQAKLRADYQQVQRIKTTPYIQALGDTIDSKERQSLIDQARKAAFDALKTGFTYHDAAVFAGAAAGATVAAQSAAFTHRGADLGVGQPGAPVAPAVQSTADLDQAIALQEALQTKTTADELAIYQSRKAFLTKRISILQSDATLTKAQKETLLGFEKELGTYDNDIESIQKTNLQNEQAAVAKQKQAYQDALALREQRLQIAQQAAGLTTTTADDLKADRSLEAFYRQEISDAKLSASQRATYQSSLISIESQIVSVQKQNLQDQLSLEEQKLQLSAQRAQLTQKSVADDKKAAKALIAFYEKEAHDARLTEAQRLQYASQAIQERITLQGLNKKNAATGATVGQIFAEAASEFGQYGSNITGRSGVLSGQDERARYSQLLLMQAADKPAAARHSQALTEAEKQTAYLARIAGALAPSGRAGTAAKPKAGAIEKARRTANIVGG